MTLDTGVGAVPDDPAVAVPKGPPPAPAKFAALKNRTCRTYLGGTLLSMMADNIEHVITYWVLWQTFHSEALAGFAVISHWLPFLLLSVYFGGIADRHDCRRVIQCAQGIYMAVSLCWALLIVTDSLQIWHACVLLVLHGLAGSMWHPAEQLMLHDLVGPHELPSAVRLNATARSLGILFGPVVGSALLLGLGATPGLLVNVLIYLPLTIFLARTRYTGHLRDGGVMRTRLSLAGALRVIREVADNPTLISMVILGGLGSFFIGASLQSAMPDFAEHLGAGDAGLAYGALLFAAGAGGVAGGLLLEVTGRVRPTVNSALVTSALFGACTFAFAISGFYPIALVFLFGAGMANLATMSIGQTLVQLEAPPDKRGVMIGVYNMSASGMRTGSGFTVGLLGGLIGLRFSLALSALTLILGTVALAVFVARATVRRRALAATSG